MNITINKATVKDIEGIMNVQNSVMVKISDIFVPENQPVLAKKGLLVYPITKKDFELILTDPECLCLVLEDNNIIVGYIVGYLLDEELEELLDLNQIEKEKLLPLQKGKTFYIHQQVVLPTYAGAGRILMKKLEENLYEQNYNCVFGSIMEFPLKNIISWNVQTSKRVGANSIGSVTDKNGITWRFFSKEIRKVNSEKLRD